MAASSQGTPSWAAGQAATAWACFPNKEFGTSEPWSTPPPPPTPLHKTCLGSRFIIIIPQPCLRYQDQKSGEGEESAM